jgi:hypothetical protein
LSVPIVSWSVVTRFRSSLFEQLLSAVEVEPEELFLVEPQAAASRTISRTSAR